MYLREFSCLFSVYCVTVLEVILLIKRACSDKEVPIPLTNGYVFLTSIDLP